MPVNRSLRRLLLSWLLLPLLILLVSSTVAAYFIALNAATDAYDKALLDPVLAMAEHVKLIDGHVDFDLPHVAQDVLLVDAYDRVYFQVTGPEGEFVAGSRGLPTPAMGLKDAPLFYDARYLGDRVRVAALSVPQQGGKRVLIQAAETLVKRDRLIGEILLGELIPATLVALASVTLVWFGVARGLAPLDRLRAEIATRSHRDLRPVPEEHAPEEVQPLVGGLNALLARLRESIDTQRRFLANAAHQLRTPLAGLQTQVELLARGDLNEEMRPRLLQLQSATRRAAHLATQLLTLARAEPAGQRLDAMQNLDLHRIIEDSAQDWVSRAVAKNIDLGFELQSAPIWGDALLIRELLANLVDNAIDYTQTGGRVTVRCHLNGGAVLEVDDNGIGIPEWARERVLERFYRIEGTPGDGSGLGLSIVQEITQVHEAALEITPPPSGRGTLIVLRFKPLATEESKLR